MSEQDEVVHRCTSPGNCSICGQLELFTVRDVGEGVRRWFALEHAEPEKLVECTACGGDGFRYHEVHGHEQDCSICHGRGKVSEVVHLRKQMEDLPHLVRMAYDLMAQLKRENMALKVELAEANEALEAARKIIVRLEARLG